ncbi:MAG TPA: hypothetical protein VFQ61_30945 [Polyangiaceae bacterium]|nr:hypothetical protein [Polyangiaceae bacterium]
MPRMCEICAVLQAPPSAGARPKLRRKLFGERLVVLCAEHAERVDSTAVSTLEELRALFLEEGGRRSLLDRRAPLDRRAFPPRPEGRRKQGRRGASDLR